jgi:hypothetical protein
MALCRPGLERLACAAQRLPARLVTTPQTVHSFTRESSAGGLARSIRSGCYACELGSGERSRTRSELDIDGAPAHIAASASPLPHDMPS